MGFIKFIEDGEIFGWGKIKIIAKFIKMPDW